MKKAMTLQYIPKIWATIVYLIMTMITLTIYLSKNLELDFFKWIPTNFYLHVSNFSISLLFCLGVGYFWLLHGVKFRVVTMLSGAIVIANILCETVMVFMNTVDLVDAFYGIIGTVLAYVFLVIVSIFGIYVNEEKNRDIKKDR